MYTRKALPIPPNATDSFRGFLHAAKANWPTRVEWFVASATNYHRQPSKLLDILARWFEDSHKTVPLAPNPRPSIPAPLSLKFPNCPFSRLSRKKRSCLRSRLGWPIATCMLMQLHHIFRVLPTLAAGNLLNSTASTAEAIICRLLLLCPHPPCPSLLSQISSPHAFAALNCRSFRILYHLL